MTTAIDNLEADTTLVRNISDTAFWPATYRARETERPNALFQDPYARRLAGSRGEKIAETLRISAADDAFGAVRTYLFDRLIMKCLKEQNIDMVVSLAAGLDASPLRLNLPGDLQWVEVDLPGILAYKENILQGVIPKCRLERVRLDLSQVTERKQLFRALGARGKRILVITEGLLPYLTAEEVESLARDLAAEPSFAFWGFELTSPGLIKMLQRRTAKELAAAKAPLKFGPAEGPGFFAPFGWVPIDVQSTLKVAATLKRLPLFMRLIALLPESSGVQGRRPWAGICLMERRGRT